MTGGNFLSRKRLALSKVGANINDATFFTQSRSTTDLHTYANVAELSQLEGRSGSGSPSTGAFPDR